LQSERKVAAKSNELLDSSRAALLHGKDLLTVRDGLLRKEAGMIRKANEHEAELLKQLADHKAMQSTEKSKISQAWASKVKDLQAKEAANKKSQGDMQIEMQRLQSSVTDKSALLAAEKIEENRVTRNLKAKMEASSEELLKQRRDLQEMKLQLEAGDDAELNVEKELQGAKVELADTKTKLKEAKKRSSHRGKQIKNLSAALIKEHSEVVEFHKNQPQAMHFDLPEAMLNSPAKKAKFLQYVD